MYGHEVLMSLQARAKLIGTLFPIHVSDIRLWRMTVYFFGNTRRQHCQAISFMLDLDNFIFPVTVANCFFYRVSPEQYRSDLTAK
jgi:hypothetical protein